MYVDLSSTIDRNTLTDDSFFAYHSTSHSAFRRCRRVMVMYASLPNLNSLHFSFVLCFSLLSRTLFAFAFSL
jgi:hypothetical protein